VIAAFTWATLPRPVAARASAQSEAPPAATAQEHYDAGMARFAARDWEAAERAFRAAYALDPRPDTLFAQAQATRLAGRCDEAIGLYQRFIAGGPARQQVEAARLSIARCETSAANAGAPPPDKAAPAAPARAGTAPTPVAQVSTTPPSTANAGAAGDRGAAPPISAARLGWARATQDRPARWLVAGGAAVAAAGVASLLLARSSNQEARAARPLDDFAESRDQAETRWLWGMTGVTIGAALVAAGLGRAVWIGYSKDGAPTAGVGGRF
jgi:tetratricopeptide (TPR) repeat protein